MLMNIYLSKLGKVVRIFLLQNQKNSTLEKQDFKSFKWKKKFDRLWNIFSLDVNWIWLVFDYIYLLEHLNC